MSPLASPFPLSQRIQFSKAKSDAIAKKEGSFVPRDKRKVGEEGRPLEKKAALPGVVGEPVFIPAPPPKVTHAQPNKILFVQNIPADMTEAAIKALFEPYGPPSQLCILCAWVCTNWRSASFCVGV